MINIEVNKKLPEELNKFVTGDDALYPITSSPMFFIVNLTEVNKFEKLMFKDTLEVSYLKIEDIPFLIVKFGDKLIFDCAIYKLEATQKEENAINFILVENTTKEVLGTRLIGLDNGIIQNLIDDTKNINISYEEFKNKGMQVQATYSIEELFNLATIKQKFSSQECTEFVLINLRTSKISSEVYNSEESAQKVVAAKDKLEREAYMVTPYTKDIAICQHIQMTFDSINEKSKDLELNKKYQVVQESLKQDYQILIDIKTIKNVLNKKIKAKTGV